jgi:hypothetical protein
MDGTAGTSAIEVGYENATDQAWARKALDLYQRGQVPQGAGIPMLLRSAAALGLQR